MNSKSNLIFLILLSIIFSVFSQIPPESDFILFNSHSQEKFKLDSVKHEFYFSFVNNEENSDIAIDLVKGEGYTVSLYVFGSYSDIKQKEDGSYEGFKAELKLNSKSLVLKKDTQLPKAKLFFILKDTEKYFYDDYITVFNEKDLIELKDSSSFIIKKFYSEKELGFKFSCKEGETVEIIIQKEKEENLTDIVILNGEEEIFNSTGKDKVETKITEHSGDFLMKIKNKGEEYTDLFQAVLIYIEGKKYKELKENSSNTLSYVNTKTFYFYADLSEYKLNEQNSVTLKVNFQVGETEITQSTFGKVIQSEDYSEENFDKAIEEAKSQNEILVQREENSDVYYTVYFINKDNLKEGLKNYLVFTFSLKMDSFSSPREVSLGLSSPIEIRALFTDAHRTQEEITIAKEIPKYIQYELPESPSNISYIFFSSLDNVQSFINGTLLYVYKEKYYINKRKIKRKIVALSRNGKNTETTFTLKFFGESSKFNFIIEGIEADMEYYRTMYRNPKDFNILMTDCTMPYFIIGDYDSTSTHYLLFNKLFGKIRAYYKSEFLLNDTFLPTEEDLIKEDYFSIASNRREIIKLECDFPSKASVHSISTSTPSYINMNGKFNLHLGKGNTIKMNLPSPKQTQPEGYFYEIFSPLNQENIQIEFIIGEEEKRTLDKEKRIYQGKIDTETYQSEVPFEIISKASDAVVFITLSKGVGNIFQEIKEGEETYTNKSDFIFEFKPTLDYESVSIKSSKIINGISTNLGRVLKTLDYVGLPSSSGCEVDLEKQSIDFSFSNPYMEYFSDKTYNMTDPFYLTISSPNNTTPLTFTIKYNPKKSQNVESNTILFTDSKTKPSIKTQSDQTEDIIINLITHPCSNNLEKINFNDNIYPIYSFDFNKTNKAQIFSVENYPPGYDLIPLFDGNKTNSIGENETSLYDGVELVYTYGSFDPTLIDNMNKEFKIKIESDNILKWDALDGFNDVSYEIYSFKRGFKDIDFVKNDCFLYELKNKTNKTNEEEYSLDVVNSTSYTIPNKDK